MVATTDVTELIDRARLGPVQILVLVLVLGTLCMVVDGFDVQAMGYVAPALIRAWGVPKPAFGPVFGAGLLGITVGSLTLSMLADRVGRRPVLIGALVVLAACMLATAYAATIQQLLILRFVTGIAMGAVIPNVMALTGEYSPARVRVTLMMLASAGFILGGALGGALAAVLIPWLGWQSVFVAGAIGPALLALTASVSLPESLQFLAARGGRDDALQRLAQRIDPGIAWAPRSIPGPASPARRARIADLFRNGLGLGTVLLWVVNFMNLLCAYFLANWLPVLMTEAGHTGSQAVLAGTVFWVGGLIGNLVLGWLVDQRGFGPVLGTTFAIAAMCVAAIGQVQGSLGLALLAIAAAGFCILGAQSGLNALGPTYYPLSIRATGTGWASGIGRLGSILGPVVAGELLRLSWPMGDLFWLAAIPVIVAMGAMLLFWLIQKGSRVGDPKDVLARIG